MITYSRIKVKINLKIILNCLFFVILRVPYFNLITNNPKVKCMCEAPMCVKLVLLVLLVNAQKKRKRSITARK